MAVIAAMGLGGVDARFVHEGLVGTTMRGRIAARTMVGDHEAIVCELTGSAWITGEHLFVLDPTDPLSAGFRLPQP
jgi:proline racemase